MSWLYSVNPAWSFSYVKIDHKEMMKFDTWVNKKWHKDGLENEKINGGWPNIIGFNLSSTSGCMEKRMLES